MEKDDFLRIIYWHCCFNYFIDTVIRLIVTHFYTFCGQYYAKINQVMPESKNLQRLTKPEIPRKTKKCEVMQHDRRAVRFWKEKSYGVFL